MHALHIADVHKTYQTKGMKDVRALRGLSFTVKQGEYFGLLGPNGAGKSTLISAIAGISRASAGSIQICGYDVTTQWRQARMCVGIVPQEIAIDPFFKVRDFLRIQAGYYGFGSAQWAWIDELLERLELTSKADSFMRTLSGGMKRRVLIAQALVHKPQVLILDEPTAGVDVELRRSLWRFTQDLHAAGHTIVLTTHYLEEAEALCSRIGILKQGQLAALEDKVTLLARHPYRYLKLALAQAITTPLDAVGQVMQQSDTLLELRLHRERESVMDVLERLRAQGVQVTDIHTREPVLEDIFVELTA